MASIKIDGIDYNIDDISDKGKEQLASIKFAQSEIQTLEARIAISKTALATYTRALQNELNN